MPDLHVKYRPKELEDFLGQDGTIRSLISLLEQEDPPHSYLFTGGSGMGKTTLARIMAKELGCTEQGIIEIDTASYSGVENARELVDSVQYPGMDPTNPYKVVILDECHTFSPQAFKVLLKTLEEPQKHLYWILCTTNPEKVPITIKTRLHAFDLKPMKEAYLVHLLKWVAGEEKLNTPEDLFGFFAAASKGSPRQALVFLNMGATCANLEEAQEVISSFTEETAVNDFCATLLRAEGDRGWAQIVSKFSKVQSETVPLRHGILGYCSAVLTKNPENLRALSLIDALQSPVVDMNHPTALLLAFAKVILDDE